MQVAIFQFWATMVDSFRPAVLTEVVFIKWLTTMLSGTQLTLLVSPVKMSTQRYEVED